MPETHVVEQGECFHSLAARFGFADADRLYRAQSEELRHKRPDPGVLEPGDEVVIPDKEPREEPCQTERRHTFVLRRPTVRVRLLLEDAYGPHAECRYLLVVDEVRYEGKTDAQGWLDEAVPAHARAGDLSVWTDEEGPPLQLRVQIGHLDPLASVSGVQARLNNLGFSCGEPSGELNPETEEALRAFQQARGLEVTGQVDDATREALGQESAE